MISKRLKQLEANGSPILVGATAEGWMGSGFVAQMAHVPGMRLAVVADSDVGAAHEALLSAGVNAANIVETASPGQAAEVIKAGKTVVTGDYSLASKIEAVDIVTDVTPSPAIGAETALAAISHGKDVVLINIEADVTVGRILKKMAKEAGVLYSVSSGDEPGCLMELYDFVSAMGMEIMVIGKGKNNPLDSKATPESVASSAEKSGKDPYQVASYVDGTKTMFEMTCAANAAGFPPMRRGMNGPEATLDTVSSIFALEEDGGMCQFPGAVDFVQGGSMSGGVFVTVRIEDSRIQDDLHYLKIGQGKYFTFFRPYHLWFIEAPISIARAYFDREVTLVSRDEPAADAAAVAKRSLRAGDRLDAFGGYTFYGVIDKEDVLRKMNALPVGLAPGARVINPIAEDQIITWDDVELDESEPVVKLRRRQDSAR